MNHRFRHTARLVLLALLAVGAAAPVSRTAVAREIVGIVREHFFDRAAGERWAADHARYADGVAGARAFADATNRALADLHASHTAYYTPREPAYWGLLSIFGPALEVPRAATAWDSIGVDVTPEHVVRTVFAGGPAERAGLRRGDRIVAADGRRFEPVLSFRGRSGRAVTLTVQRAANDPPLTVRVTPRRVTPRDEWLDAEKNGARVIERAGKNVAYVPLFSCAGTEYRDALGELIATRLGTADALVIDFRNGWGGCNPEFVSLFDRNVPVLRLTPNDGKPGGYDAVWRKPLVLLVNGGTRSGKEVVAYAVQKHRLGTLVGTRTAGAVVAGRAFLLRDRSLLLLAVADGTVDGERLEGRGVAPDVEVADALPFANGADPQLEKALEVATSGRPDTHETGAGGRPYTDGR